MAVKKVSEICLKNFIYPEVKHFPTNPGSIALKDIKNPYIWEIDVFNRVVYC